MMAKRKLRGINWVIVALGLVAVVTLSSQFGLLDTQVYIPEYASIWCGVCDVGQQTESWSHDGVKTAYKLLSCDGSNYIPKGCLLELEPRSAIGESVVYVCRGSVDPSKVRVELDRELGTFSSGAVIEGCEIYSENNKKLRTDIQNNIVIAQNSYAYIGSDVRFSALMAYEPYCLRTLERGQLSSKSDCSRAQLSKNVEDYPDSVPEMLPYGRENHIEHVVIGYSGVANSVNVIGDKFLRLGLGGDVESCRIVTDNSGQRYVDLLSCKADAAYQCVPSLPPKGYLCTNGMLVELKEDAECSGSGVIGYRVVEDKSCEVTCTSGKTGIGKCVQIIDYEKGKIDVSEAAQETDNTLLYIILGAAVVITLVIIATKPRTGALL